MAAADDHNAADRRGPHASIRRTDRHRKTVAVSPWAEVAVAYTDDNDNNTFDQVILGLDISNNSW